MPTTTREVAIAFAANPRNSFKVSRLNVSYKDGIFYSYGAPIARISMAHMSRVYGKAEVITRKYSVTTSKHTAQVTAALEAEGWKIVPTDF